MNAASGINAAPEIKPLSSILNLYKRPIKEGNKVVPENEVKDTTNIVIKISSEKLHKFVLSLKTKGIKY